MNKRLIRARVQLILNRPFYGSLSSRLELKEWDRDTFATDGKYLFYPKKYDYTDEQLESVVAHETLHCALGHLFRKGNRENFRWNIAADYAVNLALSKDNFQIPNTWLLESQYEGMTAEKIYEKIKDKVKTIKLPMKDILKPGEMSKKIKEAMDRQKGNGDKQEDQQFIQFELEQDWKDALAHAAQKNKGNIPGGLEEIIKYLVEPKIPWQQVLFRYLQASKGYSDYRAYPFNRNHVWREIYLPSLSGESIELCVAIDTSGSMGTEELKNAFSEIRGICSNFGEYRIFFWQCDCSIHEEKIIENESEIPTMVKGRGGTDFRPVFKRIEELNLEELPVVYLTDMYGDFPDKRDDVFWVTETIGATAPFGEIITIDEDK